MNEPIFIARQDTLEQEILPAHWLAQYKLFGEESYTFQDKEIWKKLCMSSAAANDRDMHAEALEEMLTTFSAEHTGKWMLTVYGMDAAVLEGLASMAAIAANGTAMAAVAGNALLMHAITNSETAMQAISRSQTAMQRIANSTTAVNASDTLVKRIYSTLTNATALFGAAQLGSQDSVENANSWATTSAAPNAFLACACGYYGSSSDSVSVTYNGTVIAQKKTGTKQPGSVASTNVNAITMAPSTFTENGDGYLAVQKFTAK